MTLNLSRISRFTALFGQPPWYPLPSNINEALPEEVHQQWLSMIPMGRTGKAEELEAAYAYLLSDTSSYTTGADINIDGGHLVR